MDLYQSKHGVFKAVRLTHENIEEIKMIVDGIERHEEIVFYNKFRSSTNRLNIGYWLCEIIDNNGDFFSISNEEFTKNYVKLDSNKEVGILRLDKPEEVFVFAKPEEINTVLPPTEQLCKSKLEELNKQISDLEDKKFRLKEEIEYIQREKAEISSYEKREYIIHKKTIEESYSEFIKTPCKGLGEQDTLDQAIALVICEAFTNGYLKGSKYLCSLTGTKLTYKQ